MTPDSPLVTQLFELEQACFGTDAWTEAQLAGACSRSGRVVVVDPGIGYVLGDQVLDEVELHRIGVHPSHRRAGHGQRLFDRFAALAHQNGATQLFLEVREDNLAARGLYEAVGMAPIGRRPKYYANNVAAVLYATPLPTASPRC